MRNLAAAQRVGSSWNTAPSGKLSFAFQDQNVLGAVPSSFIPMVLPWTDQNSIDTQNSNAVTYGPMWIERISTGQVVPVTFGGARTFVAPAGGAVVRYAADEIPASVFTGAPIARGEIFRSTGKGSVATLGHQVPRMRYKNVALSGSDYVWFDSATDVTGIDYAGTLTRPTGSTSAQRGFSLVFAGRYATPGFVSLGAVGDSIADGLQEQGAQTNTGQGPIEYINRIDTGIGYMPAVIANINLTIPTLMSAFSGERYPLPASISNWQYRAALLGELTNVLVDKFGANNFQSASTGNPTDTAANVQLRAEAAWTYLRSFKAGIPIIKTKLLPITNSNPVGGPTKASQTPAYDFAAGGQVDQWHTLLAAAVGAGKITTFFDARGPVSDATDEHYWKSNGTANYFVGETGTDPNPLTHPYAQCSILISPSLRALVDAYQGSVT